MKKEREKKILLVAMPGNIFKVNYRKKKNFGGSSSYLIGLKPFFAEKIANFNPREVKKIY